MSGSEKKLRLNIVVDPDIFPEIHAELVSLSKRKKRVDGSRFLTLATLGLAMQKGLVQPGTPPIPPHQVTPTIPEQDAKSVSDPPAIERQPEIHIDDAEAEDLQKVLSGDY